MMDRDYQSRCLDELRQAIASGKRSILCVAPTGSGKMHVAGRIIERAVSKGNTAGFLADQRELVRQCADKLSAMGVPAHCVMSGNSVRPGEDALWIKLGHVPVIAKDTLWARSFSKRAAQNKLRLEPPMLDIVLFDEAHKSLSKTWRTVAQHYLDSGSVLIGFTATPVRGDQRGLGGMYDALVQMATYQELQDQGFLVPVEVFAPTQPDLSGVKVVRGDYRERDLDKVMNHRALVGDIVSHWLKLAKGRSTVAFATSVDHSINLVKQFEHAGVTAEHLDGTTPLDQRDAIMERVRSGKTTVLCNYGVATTGVDVPQWKYMICARPTMSFSLWRQMAGRIQRPLPGHDVCTIQDHADNTLRHGFPDDDVEWALDEDLGISVTRPSVKRMRKPIRCPKCGKVYSRLPSCPSCNFKPTRQGKPVETQKGNLKRLTRKPKIHYATRAARQAEWDKWLAQAVHYNHRVGWAAHQYKNNVGKWPGRDLKRVPKGREWKLEGKAFRQRLYKRGEQLGPPKTPPIPVPKSPPIPTPAEPRSNLPTVTAPVVTKPRYPLFGDDEE